MDLTLISVPYDSALRGVRMGAGPERLIGAGLPGRLEALGHTVRLETVEHEAEPPTEIRTGFELMRGVAAQVSAAVRAGRFPIVLSGNCNTAVGTIGGLGGGVGIVWLDAHGDFHTPETTTGGFLDGTGLATATGRCWRALAATVPGFHPRNSVKFTCPWHLSIFSRMPFRGLIMNSSGTRNHLIVIWERQI